MAPNTRHAPPGTPHQGKAADTRPAGMLVGRTYDLGVPPMRCRGVRTADWPAVPCAARCCRRAVISNTEREFPSDIHVVFDRPYNQDSIAALRIRGWDDPDLEDTLGRLDVVERIAVEDHWFHEGITEVAIANGRTREGRGRSSPPPGITPEAGDVRG